MSSIYEDFVQLGPYWNTYVVGSGALDPTSTTLRLVNMDTISREMTNAQLDDYHHLPRSRFPWQPPLTMTVRARFSHGERELVGTAGFGFWNDPFIMTGKRWPALPRALWFFYASPPSDIKLDLDTPGSGWKVATIDAARRRSWLLAPAAPLVTLLMNLRGVYRFLWPLIQRTLGIYEAPLQADMTEWHTYVMHWGVQSVCFEVDGTTVMACDASLQGPLGFVVWLDNQFMVITPWGRFRYGWLAAPGDQWMEVDTLCIQPE